MKAKVKSYLQCKAVYEVVQVCPHGAPSCKVHSGSCSQADPAGGGLAYCKLCCDSVSPSQVVPGPPSPTFDIP